MAETNHPGVYTFEQAKVPQIQGVSVSTGGFVGFTEKGPLDEPIFVTSIGEFQTKCGDFRNDTYVPDAVKAFFDNGGARCYVARVAGSGAAKSTGTLDALDFATNAITVDAISEGAWGDEVGVLCRKYSTELAVALPVGAAPSITVKSTVGLEIGDIITIYGAAEQLNGMVQSYDVATKVVTFAAPLTVATGIAVDEPVYSASQHRLSTKLTVDLVNGATEAELQFAGTAKIGQVLSIGDGTTNAAVTVTGVNGLKVQFAAVTLGASIVAANSIVVSQEFKLAVYLKDNLLETHEYLTLEDTNVNDYIETRLAGDSNQSAIIEVTDLDPAVGTLAIPWTNGVQLLTGGNNGATLGDGDYIGVEQPATGLHLFDQIEAGGINMVSIPGITTVPVLSDLIDWAETRANLIAVVEPPLSVDTTEEARNFMRVTLNKNSSYYALYYPWIEVRDPLTIGTGTSRKKRVPPCGYVQGEYADTFINRGVHKAPANVVMRGPLGLTAKVGDADQDILNPIGVNAIRAFPGQGIKIFGARTGWSVIDGRHYVNVRTLLNYVKVSIASGLEPFLFEPMDPSLYSDVRETLVDFLRDLWRNGQLFPSDDVSRAFYVKVDNENNTDTDRAAGRMNVQVGINPPYPAEFILLTVSLFDGVASVDESVGLR